jgi:NTE family protein
MAIPGIFRPVTVDGRVLIDGGTTNPLPFDLLRGLADVTIAVDVLTAPPLERSDVPGTWEALYVTINIMGSAIIASKLENTTPDLLIRPNVAAFRTLDFYQATSILRTAEPVKDEVKEKLGALLSS